MLGRYHDEARWHASDGGGWPPNDALLRTGIDAQHVQHHLDKQVWDKLFKDVSPQQLAERGKPMPMGSYFKEIQEDYERMVAN